MEISRTLQLRNHVHASDGTEQRKRRRLESLDCPSHVTSQGIPQAQFPDLVPLESAQNISSQYPFVLQDTATVLEQPQNTLPDLIPLEHSQGISFGNRSFSQDTPIPDLYPIEIGLPQDIEAEVRSFVSNLDPKNHVNIMDVPPNPSNISLYNSI